MNNIVQTGSQSLLSSEMIVEIILLIFAFFMIKEASKKVIAIISGVLFIGLVFQIMFYVGQSPAEQYLHVSTLFKYDFLAWLAGLFPNTKLSVLILQFSAFLKDFVCSFAAWVINSFSGLIPKPETFGIGQ